MNRKELIEQLLDGDMNDCVFAVTESKDGERAFFEIEGIARACDSRKLGSCSYSPTMLITETTKEW
jgi:hypothetical protein